MSRRSLTDLVGAIVVLSGVGLPGCPDSNKQEVKNSVYAEEVSDEKKQNPLKILINNEPYTVTRYHLLYSRFNLFDYSWNEIKDPDLIRKAVFTKLIYNRCSNPDYKKELEFITKENDKAILDAQVSKIWEVTKRIVKGNNKIVGEVNKPLGKALGIGTETLETLVEMTVDPILLAQSVAIYDLNATRDDFIKFTESLPVKEPFSFEQAETLYDLGSRTQPINESTPDYLFHLSTEETKENLKIDPEDIEVAKSLITLPEPERRKKQKELAKKLEEKIRHSLAFKFYEGDINGHKKDGWDSITIRADEAVERAKLLDIIDEDYVETMKLKWVGDYSTPEKAVLSLNQAAQKNLDYEFFCHEYPPEEVDFKIKRGDISPDKLIYRHDGFTVDSKGDSHLKHLNSKFEAHDVRYHLYEGEEIAAVYSTKSTTENAEDLFYYMVWDLGEWRLLGPIPITPDRPDRIYRFYNSKEFRDQPRTKRLPLERSNLLFKKD